MSHRQVLVPKYMDEELHYILQYAVSAVNNIKSNSRFFSIHCKKMSLTYDTLLLHTEVRWIARGKILRRLFDLRNAVFMFVVGKKQIGKLFYQ